jgi:hypothetical protein
MPLIAYNIFADRQILISSRVHKNNIKIKTSITPLTLYATYSNTIKQIVNNSTLFPSLLVKQMEPDYAHMFNDKPRVIYKNRRNLSSLFTSTPSFSNNIDDNALIPNPCYLEDLDIAIVREFFSMSLHLHL